MSRIRMARAKKDDYENIESVDELIDASNDPPLEDIVEEDVEAPVVQLYDVRNAKTTAKVLPVKVSSKGKRTVNIRELDPNIIPPTLEHYMDKDHTGSKLAIIGKPGCFALGTKVLMYDRSVKNIEHVEIGDKVMGDDFTCRNVLELCSNTDMMYHIQPNNKGNGVVVNEKHILSLKNANGDLLDIPLDKYLENADHYSKYKWYDSSRRTMDFSVRQQCHDNYRGFILDGNRRFLLPDQSVVHNTGKSSIIKSLLFEKSEIFPCAQVYSGTEDSNHAYSSFIPGTFIFNKFSQTSYMDMIRRQKLAKNYLDNPWATIIWDDITEDEKIFNLPIVKGTYKNGRHWKVLHLLSLQYALDVKPVIRTNIDGSFLLRETNKRNRKVLFENYASAIDDYADFCSIMDQVTNDYTALYIHNRLQSNNFEDCVYWYKARNDIPVDFKFGCRETWMFDQERKDPRYVEPIEV